jgi:toxin ParE1/3/4
MRYGKTLGPAARLKVAEYRLSTLAEEDLAGIAEYGDEHFGVAQSDRYRDQLKQRFSILAKQPYLYPAIEDIRAGYRRSVCGVHSIYYHIDEQGVKIMRVLGRQDPEKRLWE